MKTTIVLGEVTVSSDSDSNEVKLDHEDMVYARLNGCLVGAFRQQDVTIWAGERDVCVLTQGLHFDVKGGLITMIRKTSDGESVEYSRPIDITALWVDADPRSV